MFTEDNYIPEHTLLQDLNTTGKSRPWKDKKIKSIKLSDSYRRLRDFKKAFIVGQCGSSLTFAECPNDGFKKLLIANFCRNRLCPMCNWRRSRMLSEQIIKILHAANQRQNMRFIFLTLTIRNCCSNELTETIDKLFSAFKRLFERKAVDSSVIGYVRTLEITYNSKTDTYHPHFHVLIGVKSTYFKDKYIKQSEWVDLWQNSLKIDYKPSVRVQIVKPKTEGQDVQSAVLETAKYSVKDSEYIIDGNDFKTDKIVSVLDKCLKGRRLIAYGKLFRDVKADLKLQDIESMNADLISGDAHDCNCPICKSNLKEVLYKWNVGLNDYVKE